MKHCHPVSHVRLEKAVDPALSSNVITLVIDILGAVIAKKSNLK